MLHSAFLSVLFLLCCTPSWNKTSGAPIIEENVDSLVAESGRSLSDLVNHLEDGHRVVEASPSPPPSSVPSAALSNSSASASSSLTVSPEHAGHSFSKGITLELVHMGQATQFDGKLKRAFQLAVAQTLSDALPSKLSVLQEDITIHKVNQPARRQEAVVSEGDVLLQESPTPIGLEYSVKFPQSARAADIDTALVALDDAAHSGGDKYRSAFCKALDANCGGECSCQDSHVLQLLEDTVAAAGKGAVAAAGTGAARLSSLVSFNPLKDWSNTAIVMAAVGLFLLVPALICCLLSIIWKDHLPKLDAREAPLQTKPKRSWCSILNI